MTTVRTETGQFTADTSTFDITVSGETRTPTGVVVFSTTATALNTNTADMCMAAGVSDFTNVASVSANSDHAQGTATDTRRHHQETNVIEITDAGTATVLRSATVAAISGGVRFTPVQSGTQFQVTVMLVFGTTCTAFSSAGDDNLATDEAFNVAHGMSNAPKAGVYFYTGQNVSDSTQASFSIGFHSNDGGIVQRAAGFRDRDNQATTAARARIMTDRVGFLCGNNATEIHGFDLTAMDGTNVTFTNRTAGNNTGRLVGLLIEADDISVNAVTVDSPTTAASDWNYNGLSFQSQAVIMCMNDVQTVASAITGADAGTYSIAMFDEGGTENSAAVAYEDGIVLGVTDTQSRISDDLYLSTDDGAVEFEMTNPSFTTDGWDIAAADISTADGTVRRWPALAFGQASGSNPLPLLGASSNAGL